MRSLYLHCILIRAEEDVQTFAAAATRSKPAKPSKEEEDEDESDSEEEAVPAKRKVKIYSMRVAFYETCLRRTRV